MTAAETPDPVIQISGLTKDYEVGFLKKRRVRALDDLSLSVQRGEIFGFLGPNGAGKTTTLKLLMRLIFPTAGTAHILGQPIDSVATRSRIGYLPENPYFYDYLSGRELLEYTGALFSLARPRARDRAAELLELVGLGGEPADRQLRKYSKGMLQRIGIAQALVNDPEVVFMDEPMSGLDPIGRREVRDLLLALRARSKTVFFSSHILSDVEALCDRCAVMTRGRLLHCGTMEQLTMQDDASLEIVALGADLSALDARRAAIPSLQTATSTPSGIQIIIKDPADIEQTLALIRQCNGHLVSINPKRRTLEELFAKPEAVE